MEISAQLVTCVVYANLLLYTFFVGSLCSKVSEQKQNEIAVSSEVNVHRGPELMERAGAQVRLITCWEALGPDIHDKYHTNDILIASLSKGIAYSIHNVCIHTHLHWSSHETVLLPIQIYWPHQHWWGKKKHKPKRKPPPKRKVGVTVQAFPVCMYACMCMQP